MGAATAGSANAGDGNAGAAGVAGALGASGNPQGGAAGEPVAGMGAAAGEQGAAGSAGAAGTTAECALTPDPQVTSGIVQRFEIELTFDGEPFQRGDVVTVGDAELSLTTFLFFLSQVSLVPRAAMQGVADVPVDLVDGNGAIEPYGVHLFDLETTDSYSFNLNVPVGQYDGMKLAVGLPVRCNSGNPADRIAPLNASSPMNWVWGFGYMFLRLEGTSTVPANPEPQPVHAHGGALGAMGTTGEALLSLDGTFAPAANSPIVLRMELRPVLELAASQSDHLAGGRAMLDALPTLDFLAFTEAQLVEPAQ